MAVPYPVAAAGTGPVFTENRHPSLPQDLQVPIVKHTAIAVNRKPLARSRWGMSAAGFQVVPTHARTFERFPPRGIPARVEVRPERALGIVPVALDDRRCSYPRAVGKHDHRHVNIRIAPASPETHRLLREWRYPPPYDFYDGDVDPVLNPERYFEARDEDGELIGFYYFEPKPPDLDYGLGLRPELAGLGLGLEFFLAGLAFGRERYRPRHVVLHVAEFNERARKVYERAGFRIVSTHVRTFERFGDVPFLTMSDGA
jgi:RimJ/RimL family protein N-acetyltransferase